MTLIICYFGILGSVSGLALQGSSGFFFGLCYFRRHLSRGSISMFRAKNDPGSFTGIPCVLNYLRRIGCFCLSGVVFYFLGQALRSGCSFRQRADLTIGGQLGLEVLFPLVMR